MCNFTKILRITIDFFQNDRDAARVLTAVAFHIRRPNKQLVREFEQLLNWQGNTNLLYRL